MLDLLLGRVAAPDDRLLDLGRAVFVDRELEMCACDDCRATRLTELERRICVPIHEHFLDCHLVGMMADLGPLIQGPQLARGRVELLGLIERLQQSITAVERCRKPVIAAVSGWCIGGGVDLITACDIRLGSRDATFSVREVKLAIVADVGTLQRLPRIVGEGHARELALTGRDIDVVEAARIGLVSRVCEDVVAEAMALAHEIAKNSPLAVQGTKRVMNFCADHPTADGLAYVAAWNAAFMQSTDLAEALAAFMQKREPDF